MTEKQLDTIAHYVVSATKADIVATDALVATAKNTISFTIIAFIQLQLKSKLLSSYKNAMAPNLCFL